MAYLLLQEAGAHGVGVGLELVLKGGTAHTVLDQQLTERRPARRGRQLRLQVASGNRERKTKLDAGRGTDFRGDSHQRAPLCMFMSSFKFTFSRSA